MSAGVEFHALSVSYKKTTAKSCVSQGKLLWLIIVLLTEQGCCGMYGKTMWTLQIIGRIMCREIV